MRRSVIHVSASGSVQAILASATTALTAVATDPISLTTDIHRLLRAAIVLTSQDTSGSLKIVSYALFWDWLSATGAQLDSAPLPSAPSLMGLSFPALADTFRSAATRGPSDLYGALNIDLGIGAVAAVRLHVNATIQNTDAANPHSVQMKVNGEIEVFPFGTVFT